MVAVQVRTGPVPLPQVLPKSHQGRGSRTAFVYFHLRQVELSVRVFVLFKKVIYPNQIVVKISP